MYDKSKIKRHRDDNAKKHRNKMQHMRAKAVMAYACKDEECVGCSVRHVLSILFAFLMSAERVSRCDICIPSMVFFCMSNITLVWAFVQTCLQPQSYPGCLMDCD